MLTSEQTQKSTDFIAKLQKLLWHNGLQIGLIITPQKVTLADISAAAPNSNQIMSLELGDEIDSESMIGYLAEGIKSGQTILLKIGANLPVAVYNQIFLLSKNGRMEYPHLEERVFVDAHPDARLILVMADKDLENCNYKNLLDVAGFVERL